jgi:hypothetical protein
MLWRSADAAVAVDAVVAVAHDPREIDRRRLRAAAAMDRPCRDRRATPVVPAGQVRIAPAGRVARRARPREIDPLGERPTINVPAHRVKRDRANQPIVLKLLLVGDHNRALVIVHVRVEGLLRHS